jgi:hypothetical protein
MLVGYIVFAKYIFLKLKKTFLNFHENIYSKFNKLLHHKFENYNFVLVHPIPIKHFLMVPRAHTQLNDENIQNSITLAYIVGLNKITSMHLFVYSSRISNNMKNTNQGSCGLGNST